MLKAYQAEQAGYAYAIGPNGQPVAQRIPGAPGKGVNTKIEGGKQLEDMMTFDDPVAYTHPWTARLIDNWDNGHRISEYVCEENNRNASTADGTTTAR